MCLHKDLKFRVRVGNTMSSERTRGRGLRQGDPAAGFLCIIVLALVYSDAKDDLSCHEDPEVREQNDNDPIKFKEALYADDVAIPGLASKLKRLQAYIISIISNLRRGGSEENRDKTVFILFTGGAKHSGNRVLSLARQKRSRAAAIRRVREKARQEGKDQDEAVARYNMTYPVKQNIQQVLPQKESASKKPADIQLYYEDLTPIKRVRSEPQLGIIVNENLDNLEELQSRVAKQDARLYLHNLVWSSAEAPLKRRVCVYGAVQEKVLTYALQTRFPTKHEEIAMAAVQARGLRRVQNISAAYFARISNYEILSYAQVTPLQVYEHRHSRPLCLFLHRDRPEGWILYEGMQALENR